MPITIEQWIKRRSAAAVAAGIGEWADSPETAFGRPIYRLVDGPVALVLSEAGFAYDGPPASFECRYDQVGHMTCASLRELLPKEGDFLPRSEQGRLLTISFVRRGAVQLIEMKFSLLSYNQVASVLPHIVARLA